MTNDIIFEFSTDKNVDILCINQLSKAYKIQSYNFSLKNFTLVSDNTIN